MTNNLMSPKFVPSSHHRRKLVRAVTAGLTGSVLALTLAACNNGTNATQDAESTPEGELQEVTVGAIAIADVAPLHLAVQEGFFEEEGLDVEIVETTGGAVSLPGVVAGDRKSTRLNSSHVAISYAVFCLKKKTQQQ